MIFYLEAIICSQIVFDETILSTKKSHTNLTCFWNVFRIELTSENHVLFRFSCQNTVSASLSIYIRTVNSQQLLSAWPNWLKHICGSFAQRHLHCTNETSRNKSSFLQYLPLFWPIQQLKASIEPKLSLSQNIPIS